MSDVGPVERKNACRHFLGMFPDGRETCAKGWDVRKWAVKCNGGSELGIGLRLPCTKRAEGSGKPLFDCPDLDRKTNAEIAEQRAKMDAHMNKLVRSLPAIGKMKDKMIANNLSSAKATCPWCDEKDALKLSCALEVNNHVHARCASCGEGFME